MKRKFIWAINIFIIITISILIYFYVNTTYTYQRIDIYTAKNFNKEKNTPLISINDKNKLKEISTIIRMSKKMPGILNVVSPEYILEIHGFNKSMHTVYLWIGKDSVKGMYMYKDNTESGYSISETNAQKLRKIVITTNN
ncbi:hypothetical protein LL037_17800 [Clostridium estertheticum]|uniref:YhfM-like domain-containing protein n=1 Tax=Clostridium estertheticum TaxID=238834 RepID=A0AA47I863_9CLOT|nr:hypothetical protein [Clostridium estertheticum]MBU3153655.1 hypothetical protein [Clostridium estertheticum]MBU3199008.1 hypothetical protein [Clostridium estertheticum]WAG61555.1 hypothetical protein LL038_04725 [Clostridium estertheticum]WAG64316.1 hypothetical protein LL037_17800 [Clostridium estertheticum]